MELKPEDLRIGMKFRLTGEACNEAERNDKNTYEVMNRDSACKLGAHVIVQSSEGKVQEMKILPWVKLIKVEP